MRVVGVRNIYRTVATGTVHCERCGGDRPYRQRSGRTWVHVLWIPLVRRGEVGEHLKCSVCGTCYRVELLAVPTLDQMQDALIDGTMAAALAMLHAGGVSSPAARYRAIELMRSSGLPDYGDEMLAIALAGSESPEESAMLAGIDTTVSPDAGLRPAIEGLALQLEVHAREWFLSKVVRIGLADGSLSELEREEIGTIARYLGMSQSRAEYVISRTEEAAQAG